MAKRQQQPLVLHIDPTRLPFPRHPAETAPTGAFSRWRQLTRWRRFLLKLGMLSVLLVALCAVAYVAQPHDAKHIIPSVAAANAAKRPAGTTVVLSVNGDVDWWLAQQHQMSSNNLSQMKAAQSGAPTVAERQLSDFGRHNSTLAGILGLLALLAFAAGRLWDARKRLLRPLSANRSKRLAFTVLAAALLTLYAVAPAAASFVSRLPLTADVSLGSLGQKQLVKTTTDQDVLDPFVRVYGPTQDAKADRAFADKVLAGQPVPITEAQRHQEIAATIHGGYRASVVKSAFAYAAIRNGPSWLLTQLMFGFRRTYYGISASFVLQLGLWGLGRGRTLRRIAHALTGISILVIAGLLVSGLLLTGFNWLCVALPHIVSGFPGAWLATAFAMFIAGVGVLWTLHWLVWRAVAFVKWYDRYAGVA